MRYVPDTLLEPLYDHTDKVTTSLEAGRRFASSLDRRVSPHSAWGVFLGRYGSKKNVRAAQLTVLLISDLSSIDQSVTKSFVLKPP